MRTEVTKIPKPKKHRSGLLPAAIRRKQAAAFCGVSVTVWDRLTAAGKTPMPFRLGKAVLWRRKELAEWVDANAPPREEWDAIRAARNSS